MAKAAPKFSLKDRLFNKDTVAQMGAEYEAGLLDFDRAAFETACLNGIKERSLLECLQWFASCLEPYLERDFSAMAKQLKSALPRRLDPGKSDNDFGHFIHAVPGVLAVRHGLDHPDCALDLLYEATQRFSMEAYIRPFLNQWPDKTLAHLALWAKDDNYHVRRLVSEGTRPKLPWAGKVHLSLSQTLPLLDLLHADPTRYVTRSVANHLNDISKIDPDAVLASLEKWMSLHQQTPGELHWMRKHALRTLVKAGHEGALAHLGFRSDVAIEGQLVLAQRSVARGDAIDFDVHLTAQEAVNAVVDYRILFADHQGRRREKVYKIKSVQLKAHEKHELTKSHFFKADATTFALYPGTHQIILQVNGRDLASASLELT